MKNNFRATNIAPIIAPIAKTIIPNTLTTQREVGSCGCKSDHCESSGTLVAFYKSEITSKKI